MRTVQHVGFGVSIRRAAGGWAAGFQDERVTRRGLETAKRLGLETTVYTVDDPARMRQLRDWGVTGVFTDDPRLARAALGYVPSPMSGSSSVSVSS
jgi:glycerophosphoryl diester phosphodiesterase